MCQILQTTLRLDKDVIKKVLDEKTYFIIELLGEKGGEDYSFTYFINDKKYNTLYCTRDNANITFKKFVSEIYEQVDKLNEKNEFEDDEYVIIVLFSRQAPEMEAQEGSIKPAPYLVKNKLIWMHGTVANQEEIEKKLEKKFDVDSKVFGYWKHLLKKDTIIKGVYATYFIDIESGDNGWLYNGIGLWEASQTINGNRYAWTGTSPYINVLVNGEIIEESVYKDMAPYYVSEANKSVMYIAFSGGMDVIMSTYAFMKDRIVKVSGDINEYIDKNKIFFYTNHHGILANGDIEYKLIYFDYGARARDYEIAAMKKFTEFVKNEMPDVKITYEIVNVKTIFNELSKLNNYESKLMSENAAGELAETEANLAYVPYRNTQFGILLGALIDRDLENELFLPNIIYGLNLTEMGVYVDNTEVWLKSMQRAIRYGGKNYKKVDIIAPFVNTTKTNMLTFMILKYGYNKVKELLNIAFSCYYPSENGEPCGECGSCILRQKALERALSKAKKMKLEVKK